MSGPFFRRPVGVHPLVISLAVAAFLPVPVRAGLPLHELPAKRQVEAVLKLMDTEAGAAALGRYVAAAREGKPLATARAVAEMMAARARGERSEAEKKRLLAFARAAASSSDEALLVEVLTCIARLGVRGATDEVLAGFFSHPSERVRRMALETAVSAAGAGLLDPLAKVAADEKRPVRERLAALQALGGLGGEEALRVLARSLSAEPVTLAVNAVRAAARVPAPGAVRLLLEAASSTRAPVRRAAYQGLVSFRLAEGFPGERVSGLWKGRGAPEDDLLALLAACGEERALALAARRLLETARPGARLVLLDGLGMSGRPQMLAVVKKIARRHAQEEPVLLRCYLAAGRIGGTAAADWLLDRLEGEEAFSRAVPVLFDALTVAGEVPADRVLPLLAGSDKRPPAHLFLLALARGPLERSARSLAALKRVLEAGGTDRVAGAGLALLAARGSGEARQLLEGRPELKPLLARPPGLDAAEREAAWRFGLYAVSDARTLARLLHRRLASGRPLALLAAACVSNRAALAAALGAWEKLPEPTRRECLHLLEVKYGLPALGWLAGHPPDRLGRELSFLLGVRPCPYRPPPRTQTTASPLKNRLVDDGGTLRWEEEPGMLRTPIILMPLDLPGRDEIARRLLDRGAMVIDEPFMAVDVAVVEKEGEKPPCEAKRVMTLREAAALAGPGR